MRNFSGLALFWYTILGLALSPAAGAESTIAPVSKMAFPIFTEGPPSRSDSGAHVRTFTVVLPGYEATGIFKSITVKDGQLKMEPADKEQLFFKPVNKPVISHIMLVSGGVIAAELLKRR